MNYNSFLQLPIMPILRGINQEECKALFDCFLECGITAAEITLNTKDALLLIEEASKLYGDRLSVGAGTVLSKKEAKQAYDAGATFIVAPNLNIEVANVCKSKKIEYFPGALTPAEVYAAHISGATMVKIFPAWVYGPKYFKELKGPFCDIKTMAVGGVKVDNVKDYFDCGASAIAIGSGTFKRDLLNARAYGTIKNKLMEYVNIYQGMKNESK